MSSAAAQPGKKAGELTRSCRRRGYGVRRRSPTSRFGRTGSPLEGKRRTSGCQLRVAVLFRRSRPQSDALPRQLQLARLSVPGTVLCDSMADRYEFRARRKAPSRSG
jgi:hypothetical protein